MNGVVRFRGCLGFVLVLSGLAGLIAAIVSCSTAPTAFLVQGAGGSTGSDPPTLTISVPSANTTVDQGGNLLVRWTDNDRDSNAMISFMLINTVTNDTVVLVQNVSEDDSVGPDRFTIDTSLIPQGTYNLLGVIDDGLNTPYETYAMNSEGETTAERTQRAVITIVPPGQGPPTVPPIVTVVEPAFNLSVSQDDVLHIVVQPSDIAPPDEDDDGGDETPPFDPDSDATLYIVLDMDTDPNNDDPANPDPDSIITLRTDPIQAGEFQERTYDIEVDLQDIPPRDDGEPYYIRASIDDATNPRVHQYAVGTISVTQLAAGTVDLFDVGRTISGATFYGFSPGANLGSTISHVGDFDADGVDDFVMVAQYGNPRNYGRIGEAYLLYGHDQTRFGGSLAVNTVSEAVDGVIFEAPPVRSTAVTDSDPRTDGISDVSFIQDLTGDGRPELLFGLRHVHGALDSMDYDPGDTDMDDADTTVQVEVLIRQGLTRVTAGDEIEDEDSQYFGVDDVTISSANPSAFAGSDSDLTWENSGASQREWTLLKFKDVLSVIPDESETIDIASVRATISFRVFGTGDDGTVYQCVTDFDERTTYSTFAAGGGAPQGGLLGSAGIDYVTEEDGEGGELGSVAGDSVDTVDVDVSDLVTSLIDGTLVDYDNELRFIIVAGNDAEERTSVRSSEYTIEGDRPTLTIEYTRQDFLAEWSCYPDDLVNNSSDEPDDLYDDIYWYAGGMALVVNSTNRDNNGLINPDRLDSAVLTLELVGQKAELVLDADDVEAEGGLIFARVDNSGAAETGEDADTADRVSGARIVAGPYDDVDSRLLRQGPREGLFGDCVSSLGDLNHDGVDEIMISAPANERYMDDLFTFYGYQGTQRASSVYRGSIVVLPGINYNDNEWRDQTDDANGTAGLPFLDHHIDEPYGRCGSNPEPRHQWGPADSFQVFAEDIDDMLGGARSAGDFNQDGLDDILCGAPLNDRTSYTQDTGAAYVLYGRNVMGNFYLSRADDSSLRPPMLRIRGVTPGDEVGTVQAAGMDVNGDRVDDIFIASPKVDFGGVTKTTCAGDYNGDGVVDTTDLDRYAFSSCQSAHEDGVFTDDACKVYDYDNSGLIDDDDENVFRCLADGGTDCCEYVADNGYVAVVFGGVFIDGDRTIDQVATDDLPGAVFYGAAAGHRAGTDVDSAGDFNQDGFGDILITVPGETRLDVSGRERLGVAYLIFGGTHLYNTTWSLSQVGSSELPGVVFLSPYVKGRPNEAPMTSVANIGDINNDGFGDIAVGNPTADFMDQTFPQGPDATDAALGRRSDAGDVYIIYGNNYGSNRAMP